MRIGIGLSLDPDPRKAGAEAVRQAKETVPKPSLAIVFGSIHHDQKKVHAGVCSELDPRILTGGSSYAEITTAGVTKKSVAALLLDLDGVKPRFSNAEVGRDPRRTGRDLTKGLCVKLDGGLPLGLLFSSVATGYENETIKSLTSCLGGVPVAGGMLCGDYDLGMSHPEFWLNYQYLGPKLSKRGARLALLDLPKKDYGLAFGFEHGWSPVAPPVTVTKANGGDIYEVDGIPIFDYYRQFLGRAGSKDFFELQIQRYGFSLHLSGAYEGTTLLKLPVACDAARGFISYFPAEDLQDRKVQLILASRKGLVGGAQSAARRCLKALDGRKPSLLFIVSCCTRNAILHSRMDSEVDAIRRVMGRDVPVFGFYSGGEIMPFLNSYADVTNLELPLSGSRFHTTTVGIVALATRLKPAAVAAPPRRALKADPDQINDMLAKSEKVLDSTESFLANLSRKSYQDSEVLKKQNEIIHRYTPHDVYRQIGAGVAKGQYELFDAEFNGCFLFMDVKGFTSYTEDHGSKDVVRVLNEIFEPATEIIYDCSGDVDKFIGDCIFAVFKRPEKAVAAGKRILVLFEGLRRKGNPFTVRIGINSGRAVRANVGSRSRREYTYIGDAVNLAQRLEANCTPGRLLLSQEVFRRAATDFKTAARREIAVKGKKASVVAYECVP
ncbi:MAG: FIST C-terminal domain-containing protein [Elusimicrobia bacterium]|nr:FIST C-terminal domain-containing protein [Elusimicrobiota bacterium]